MKIYFLSSKPCALTLNGAYFGITDSFSRFAEIPLKDNVLATFTPENSLPLSCFLNESLRFAPPRGFEIYILKDGLALYAKTFLPIDLSLRVYAQKRKDDLLVTLFRQGELQLSIEKGNSLFISTLPLSFADLSIDFHNDFILLNGKNRLLLYTQTGKLLLNEEILSYSVEKNRLNATLPLSNSLRSIMDCEWELSENECKLLRFSVKTEKKEYRESLIPYVFFESLLIGGDCEEYLSNELCKEQERLKAFIGEFESVFLTGEEKEIAVLRKKKENVFEASYFQVEMHEGKITDVKG